MNDTEQTKQFLSEQRHMVISVVDSEGPWAVPVTIQSWEGRTLTWDSRLDTRHSKALQEGARLAITMFRPRTPEQGQFGFCASADITSVTPLSDTTARYSAEITKAWINDESFVKREAIL